jgi:hypothetical protein
MSREATNFVTVASFSDLQPALRLQNILHSKGVTSEIQERHWFSTEKTGGIKLKVRHRDWNYVKTLLNDLDNDEEILKGAIQCPECGSARVQYPQLSRKFITPSIVATFIPFLKWKFYCQDCHCMWSQNDEKEPQRKIPFFKTIIKQDS